MAEILKFRSIEEMEWWRRNYLAMVGCSNTVDPGSPERWADRAVEDLRQRIPDDFYNMTIKGE